MATLTDTWATSTCTETADATWYGWSSTVTGTSTTCTVDLTTSASSTTDTVWYGWAGNVPSQGHSPPPLQESVADRQARMERQAERNLEAVRRAEERRVAAARAEELLREHLSGDQVEELNTLNRFTVISKDGKREYQIRRDRVQNVDLIGPDGRRLRNYCAHPASAIPDQDTMLAQKLMIENQEEEFLRIAVAS